MTRAFAILAAIGVTLTSMAYAANDEAPWSGCPRFMVAPKPVYPERARAQNAQGSVTVAVNVGTDGKVIRAHVTATSGWVDLDVAAVRAARDAQFEPSDAPTWCKVPINFVLR